MELFIDELFLFFCQINNTLHVIEKLIENIHVNGLFIMCRRNKNCFVVNFFCTEICRIVKVCYKNKRIILVFVFFYEFNKFGNEGTSCNQSLFLKVFCVNAEVMHHNLRRSLNQSVSFFFNRKSSDRNSVYLFDVFFEIIGPGLKIKRLAG